MTQPKRKFTHQDAKPDFEQVKKEYSEFKRRLAWEFDGMRLHELYFENLGGGGIIHGKVALIEQLAQNFGSYDTWEEAYSSLLNMSGNYMCLLSVVESDKIGKSARDVKR